MAQTQISGVGGLISGSRVSIDHLSYVESQNLPVALAHCWIAEQGTTPGSRSPSIEFPIVTTSGVSGAALSEGFSAMTPGPITVASTTISSVLQGASTGATNAVFTDIEYDLDASGVYVDALKLALAKRANTLVNTAVLTITSSVGGAYAATWALLRSAVSTARGTKGNGVLVMATVPRKFMSDLASEVGAEGSAILSNPNVQQGDAYDRVRALTADLFDVDGEPASYYFKDLNCVLTVAERDADCPTNGGNYEIGVVVAPPDFQRAIRLAAESSAIPTRRRDRIVTPTLGCVVTPNPVPATKRSAIQWVDDDVLGIPITIATRAYVGADGVQMDAFMKFNAALLVDSACRMIFIA